MRKSIAGAALLAVLITGYFWGRQAAPEAPLGGGRVTQVGIVVRDIARSAQEYARVLGVPAPSWEITDPVEKAHTTYLGKPSPARAKLAFIALPNVTLELIEPVGGPSTWADALAAKGEGVHHLAFEVKGMDAVLAGLAARGVPLLQRGDYEGGRYAYVDATKSLGLVLELLESF